MITFSPHQVKRDGFVPVSSFRFFVCAGVVTLLFAAGANALAHGDANQTTLDKIEVTLELKNENLKALFKKIESQTDLKFVFFENQVSSFSGLTLARATRSVRSVLEMMLAGTGLSYIQSDNTVYIRKGSGTAQNNNSGTSFVEKIPFLPAPKPATVPYFTVTGKVTDAMDAQPMAGVSIVIKGTTNGTTTNTEGEFALQVDAADYLVFSFIGYQTLEVPVSGKTLIDVSLQEDATTLDAVTVGTTYWQVTAVESTGSFSKVSADIIEKQPVTNPIATIAGRMPGVYVEQTTGVPGGEFKIQVRGMNSLRPDGNEPLYIIDGVPFSTDRVSSQAVSSSTFGAYAASPFTGINLSDIESIEVLKDADATAIYGSRGANGVVLITTKKGKSGKTKVDMNAYYGVGRAAMLDLVNTQQYMALRREAFALESVTPSADPESPAYAPDLTVWDTTRYTNWQRVFYGNQPATTSVQASLSGGSEYTQFMLSGGYRKETSPYPGDFGYTKGSTHLSMNHLSSDRKFSINSSFSGSVDSNHQPGFDPIGATRFAPPNNPGLYNEDGTLNWDRAAWPNGNPLGLLTQTYNNAVNTVIVSAELGYEILPKLWIKNRAGFTSVQSKEFSATPSTVFNPAENRTSTDALARTSEGSNQSWILEPQATWDMTLGQGKLSVLFGGTFQGQQRQVTVLQYTGFPSDALIHDVNSSSFAHSVEYTSSRYKYIAAFGRINYSWAGKYFLNLTGRRDGSSRFGPGRKFANFGAVGAAWIFSQESFVKNNLGFLSFGKIRGSYGVTGSDRIGDYSYLDTYSSTGNTYQNVTGLAPTRLFNADYAWEANKKMEGALELGFLNDRVFLTAAYFNNISTNQLVNYTLPMTTGGQGITANLPATVENTGLELELKTVNVDNRIVNWRTSANFTIPKNRLTSFPNLESSTYANTYVIGQPLSIGRYLNYTGVNPQTGLYTFTDFNEDGVISIIDDRKVFAFIGQHFFGGLNNSVTWKGFTLDVFLQVVKQSSINSSRVVAPGSKTNVPEFVLKEKIWRQPGDHATIQRMTATGDEKVTNAAYLLSQSDAVILDASFIRLKNLSVSYTLNEKWLKSASCRLYVQGQNLFTITAAKSFDPEGQDVILAPLRIFTAGVQFTL